MILNLVPSAKAILHCSNKPVKIGIIAMVSNMAFNLLAIPFSYVGLAMASAMSATLNAYLLYRGLAKADVYHFSRQSAVFFLKVFCAAAMMGLLVWYNSPTLIEWNAMSFLTRVHWLAWLIVLAAMVYGGILVLLGIRKRDLMGVHTARNSLL